MNPDKLNNIVLELLEKYPNEAKNALIADNNDTITAIAFCIVEKLLIAGPTPEILNYVKVCCEVLFCEGKSDEIKLDKTIWGE